MGTEAKAAGDKAAAKTVQKEAQKKQVDPLAKETSKPKAEVTPLAQEGKALHPKVVKKLNAISASVKSDPKMNAKAEAAYAKYKKNPIKPVGFCKCPKGS